MNNDVKHLFMCFTGHSYIFFCQMCVHVFVCVCVFMSFATEKKSFVSLLYYLIKIFFNTIPLLHLSWLFPQVSGLHFIFLMVSFEEQKF